MGSGIWTLANLITVLRIGLTLPFVFLISEGRLGIALVVFGVASLTDLADGYMARRYNQQTSVGRILDPLADKLLTTAGFVVMAIPREGFPSIPIWLAGAVVLRDIAILLGALIVYLRTRFTQFEPSLAGKLNTVLELGVIVVFLLVHTAGVMTVVLTPLYVVVLASVVISGAGYVVRGIQIYKTHRRARQTDLPLPTEQA